MLGRGVAQRLSQDPGRGVVDDDVAEAAGRADLFVCNLECCISERGHPWPDERKPFFFRAPPSAAATLAEMGVDAVTMANNHALDYGEVALADTIGWLDAAGIAHVGAGPDLTAARRPVALERSGQRVELIAFSDHPADFAATAERPGIAFAELPGPLPQWVRTAVEEARDVADAVVVSPHWGPNMVAAPVRHVTEAADELAACGPALVAGHSAHVFHGVAVRDRTAVLYDLGDFVDDYRVDPRFRNDLGVLWFVEFVDGRVVAVEALPLTLGHAFTRVATGADRDWVARRFRDVCAPLDVGERDGRMRVELSDVGRSGDV